MRRVVLGLLLVLLLVTPVFTFSGTATAAPNVPGWNLVFEDDFNQGGLDSSKYQTYWGGISASWWNGGKSVSTENGLLRLKIDKQTVTQKGKTYKYTAGGFNQLTALTNGRWVVRARLPMEVGNQSYISLWRKDFSWPPEIDFAEAIGTRPKEHVFSQHYSDGGKVRWDGHTLKNFDSTAFHEYVVEWNAGKITWIVDGKQRYTTTQKFSNFPMVLAVGDFIGTCSSFSGCPDSTTSYPSYLDIDYIRIYKKS